MGIGLFQGATNFFLNGIVLSVLYGGSSLINSGQMSPGELMSFLVTAQTIQRSLSQLSVVFGNAVRGWTAGARAFEFVNLRPSIPNNDGVCIPYHTLWGEVRFEDVDFAYPTRPDHQVFEKLNLTIPAGQIVALCGPSGEGKWSKKVRSGLLNIPLIGKTTITSLLERFYEPVSGRVLLDNQDLKTLNVEWLRGQVIGLISQEPVLFATTIEENIRYGRPGATRKEVIKAAKLANAHDFIAKFPDGYSTVVGERGAQLSGGQKQRIAIARALLKDPPILVLDEATSALDSESERLVS
ncbi:unnamed protein product [Cylicostephanus goldi]|uniref:ABC transporter domain-containing protein n=1 Tax=Cylicostephanus goldi TaxID=71465 RepID=A0A3P7MYJ0_CYLGO|nr:unnamed protein product [Cylicostephanus goldi]